MFKKLKAFWNSDAMDKAICIIGLIALAIFPWK